MSRYFNYTEDDYIAHFGIKGMKWGVRRYQKSNGSLTSAGKTRYTHAQKKAIHQAKKDAEEYARAKMFYGEGAGTRRKLIKSTVKQRSKDSLYKQTFDNELAGKDWAKEVSKAKGERKRKDAKKNVAKAKKNVAKTARFAGLAIGTGIAFYVKNKSKIDSFIRSNMNKGFKYSSNKPELSSVMIDVPFREIND